MKLKPPPPDQRALQWLMATAAFALAPLALELPAWTLIAFVGCAAWRYAGERYRWYRPGILVRGLLTLLAVTAVYWQYRTLLGRDPGLTLLLALLGLKLLELKTLRDYLLSMFLLYLVILGGFLYAQSLWIGLWAVVAVLVSLAALARLHQPPGTSARINLRIAATLLAQSLPLMLILYLLFPRVQVALWSVPTESRAAQTGMLDVMRPGSIHHLSQSPEVAFRVVFTDPAPPPRNLYWRTLVLWETDGREWRPGRPPIQDESFTPVSPAVRYSVSLEPTHKSWIPALDLPAAAAPGMHWRPGFTLEWREAVRKRLTYALASHLDHRTGASGAAELDSALQLPERVSPRVRALAEQWRHEGVDAPAVVRAALAFFRQEKFVYTLSPPLLGEDPVDEFLFRTRRGFCEHYAAAFVTLMRAAGVPSRVVVGYQGGELNPAGGYFIVRQADAHAWAEVRLPTQGWVRVDPTAAVAPERVEYGIEAVRRLQAQGVPLGGQQPLAAVRRALELDWLGGARRAARLYWDLANLSWYNWVEDYGYERQRYLLGRMGFEKASWAQLLTILAVGVVALAFGYIAFLLRSHPRRDPVQARYLAFCRKLARAGLIRAPQEGPLDYARRVSRARADLGPAVWQITRLYLELRYGPGGSREDRRAFRRAIAAFRA